VNRMKFRAIFSWFKVYQVRGSIVRHHVLVRRRNLTHIYFTDATTPQMLQLLFQQFPGFTCATLSENKPRTGLIEFDAHVSALYALRGLQGFRLNATHSLLISFTTR